MATYRLLPHTGTHRKKDRDYNSGETIESDQDLTVVFPLKFEKVAIEKPSQVDVTNQFSAATDNGFLVYQRASWFYVCEGDREISGALREAVVEDFVWDHVEGTTK